MGFSKKLPPGTYFIGDPCYALADDDYDEIMQQKFRGRRMVKSEGYFPIEGHPVGVALADTDGDGSFLDGEGFEYGVDAGMIGITPAALIAPGEKKKLGGLGRVVTFRKPITFTAGKTSIKIVSDRSITISLLVLGS